MNEIVVQLAVQIHACFPRISRHPVGHGQYVVEAWSMPRTHDFNVDTAGNVAGCIECPRSTTRLHKRATTEESNGGWLGVVGCQNLINVGCWNRHVDHAS